MIILSRTKKDIRHDMIILECKLVTLYDHEFHVRSKSE